MKPNHKNYKLFKGESKMAHKAKQGKHKTWMEKNFHMIVIAVVTLVLAIVYFVEPHNGGTAVASSPDPPTEATLMGNSSDAPMAPDFTLTSTDGKTISLSGYRGKVVIVDFFATWCPPCQAEIPDYIKLYSEYRKDGFQMLGISVDQGGLNAVRPFMKKYGVNYPVMLATDEIVSAYGGIRGIPTTFVIDKEGRVAASFMGYRPASVFENLIQKLTKEKQVNRNE